MNISYKFICNFSFIVPEYVEEIFIKIIDEYKINNIEDEKKENIRKKNFNIFKKLI